MTLHTVLEATVMCALQEAMRVRPVAATGSTRYIKHDMTVGGYYLPKGTMVDVPFYAVSYPAKSPGAYPDPDLHVHNRLS